MGTRHLDHASITVEVAYFGIGIETEEETPMFKGTPAELVEWCKSYHDA